MVFSSLKLRKDNSTNSLLGKEDFDGNRRTQLTWMTETYSLLQGILITDSRVAVSAQIQSEDFLILMYF